MPSSNSPHPSNPPRPPHPSDPLRWLAQDADRFAVLDTETTGLYNSDRIVEIAIVTMSLDGKITDIWETLIQPERDIGAAEIHGVTAGMVVHAPLFREVAGDVAERLDGACVVGHYVGSFDLRMIANEFDRLPGAPGDFDCRGHLDTRRIFPGRLVEACDRFGIPLLDAHCARADAEAAAELFLAAPERFDGAGAASRVRAGLRPTGRMFRRSELGAAAQSPGSGLGCGPERGSGCDKAELYLRMLDQVLADGVIDADERQQLAGLAEQLDLTPDEVEALCLEKVSRKIDEVLADGILTIEEHAELMQTVEQCGVGSDVVQRRIREFLGVGGGLGTGEAEPPCTLPELELERGDEIVVTGQHLRFTRDQICATLRDRGFTIGGSVTKSRTKLLLAADTATESGKAKQARKWGIPVMPLVEFDSLWPGG